MKIIKIICALLMFTCLSVSQASVMHITDNSGNLLGAQNVEVNGTLYNVKFLDGTCAEIFNGCDDANDFMFKHRTEATLASQALLNAVFLDDNANFDSIPSLTNGCNHGSVCYIWTPYNISPSFILASLAENSLYEDYDAELLGNINFNIDFSDFNVFTWGVWSTTTVVSEPGTAIFLSLGITVMFLFLRRQ